MAMDIHQSFYLLIYCRHSVTILVHIHTKGWMRNAASFSILIGQAEAEIHLQLNTMHKSYPKAGKEEEGTILRQDLKNICNN